MVKIDVSCVYEYLFLHITNVTHSIVLNLSSLILKFKWFSKTISNLFF